MKIDAVSTTRLSDLLASRETAAANPKTAPPASPQAAPPAGDAPTDPTQLQDAVSRINKTLADLSQSSLEFSIDQDSQRTVVKVIDQSTKEVIRQIPSEEALEIAKSLQSAQGILLKQEA